MRAEKPLEVFLAALDRRPASRLPVAPHWWGVWKYEALGLPMPDSAWQDGAALAEVYLRFHAAFPSDWLHLHIGTPRWFRGCRIVSGPDGRSRLAVDAGMRQLKAEDRYLSVGSGDDEDIADFPDYLLGSRVRRPRVDLSSERSVDAYVDRYVRMSAGEIDGLGYADHVRLVAGQVANEALVAVHIPSAVCEIFDPSTGYTGFEGGLLAFHDNPAGMRRLLARCYEAQLEWARAYRRAGAHAFVISESFVSPDLVDPAVYRSFLKGVHCEYFREIGRMGLVPMVMFWGDVLPILDDLCEIGARALMVEEPKKGFDLEIRRIRERLAGRLCLFGNLDSITLLAQGTPGQVEAEVARQGAEAGPGFVTANGSPIVPGTPAGNVRALIEAGRRLGRTAGEGGL